MKGKHLIADIINITDFELLKTIEGIEPLMRKIIEEMELNVVGEVKHQFQPYGATMLYLLAESHLSIHTYVDERYVAIDLYCCNPNIDMNIALDVIFRYFNGNCIIRKTVLQR